MSASSTVVKRKFPKLVNMTDTPPTPVPDPPPTTAPPKADPAPAPAPQPAAPAPATLTGDDGLLGRLTQAMDDRFDRLAGRLESNLRPPVPEPETIAAPEHVEPPPADPAPAAKRRGFSGWYHGK